MPVEVSLCGECSVYVYFQFETPWTIKEFWDANAIAGAWVRNLDGEMDAIFDFGDISTLPSSIISEALQAIRHTQQQPNQGKTVIITRSVFVRHIVHIVGRLAPSYGLFIARDIDHAERIIDRLAQAHTRPTRPYTSRFQTP